MTPADVLVLSGIPGAGKSHFAKWLAERGWQRVDHDHLRGSPLEMAWIELLERLDVAGLLAAKGQKPLVVEWGYPPHPQIVGRARALVAAGFNCWWFDADETAALAAWRRAWGVTTTEGEQPFHNQLQRIKQAWPEMATIYGPRVLRVLKPGLPRVRMVPGEVAAAMGLAPGSPA